MGNTPETKVIPYYKTEMGLLVMLELSYSNKAEHVHINDGTIKKTYHPSWWIAEGETELKSYSTWGGIERLNERYELKQERVSGLPSTILPSELEKDDNYTWVGKHEGLEGLYELKFEERDRGFIEQLLEAKFLGEIQFSNLDDPSRFSYKIAAQRFDENAETLDYNSLINGRSWAEQITVHDITKALQPQFAWHLHPCLVSSLTAYRIIRQHVKDNIDPKWAEITSDYDFCFTIKKRIRHKPIPQQKEIKKFNGRSYRTPKFKHYTTDYQLVEIFEMTHEKERYRGYTPVEGFKGDTLKQLCEGIDTYLAELMRVINEPLAHCPECGGCGIVDFEKIKTNDRFAIFPQATGKAGA